MEDRSNIIKEAIEYRDKLEKKVEELAQSIVRLQISLDFADNTIKKKDKENAELKAENARLKSCLQEIKAIVKGVRGYLKVPTPRDVRFEMDRIIDLITKAESEEE